MPRGTVKRFQPLDSLARRTRLQLAIRADAAMVPEIARELEGARGGNGVVRIQLRLATGGEANLIAGRDFILDAELTARIERVVGEGNADLRAQESPKLALVG